MEKRLVFTSQFQENDKDDNKIYLPLNRALVNWLEREISSIKSFKDLYARIKGDFGLLLSVFEIPKVRECINDQCRLWEVTLETEDLEFFVSNLKKKTFFYHENISALQWSSLKINSLLTVLAEKLPGQDLFTMIRLVLPFIYFSFYTPNWFERIIKKSPGSFEDVLLRCYDSGPIKASEVEKFFLNFNFGGSLVDAYAEKKELLSLSAASEPTLYYVDASNIQSILRSDKLLQYGITQKAFEDALQHWSSKWKNMAPPMITNLYTLGEIIDIAKKTKGRKVLESKLDKLKIFELDSNLFEIFFGEITPGYPSLEALRVLFTEILPICGYSFAITMLFDENRRFLVPRLKTGKARNTFIPTIIVSAPKKEELPFVITSVDGKIQKLEQDVIWGLEGNFFLVPLNYEKHSGILILGTEPEDRSSISIEAIKKAERVSELLGLALGY